MLSENFVMCASFSIFVICPWSLSPSAGSPLCLYNTQFSTDGPSALNSRQLSRNVRHNIPDSKTVIKVNPMWHKYNNENKIHPAPSLSRGAVFSGGAGEHKIQNLQYHQEPHSGLQSLPWSGLFACGVWLSLDRRWILRPQRRVFQWWKNKIKRQWEGGWGVPDTWGQGGRTASISGWNRQKWKISWGSEKVVSFATNLLFRSLMRFCFIGRALIISLKNPCTIWTPSPDSLRKPLRPSQDFSLTHSPQRTPLKQRRLKLQLRQKLVRLDLLWSKKWGTHLRIWSPSSSPPQFIIIRKCRNIKDLPQTKITNPRKWVSTSSQATMLGSRAKG